MNTRSSSFTRIGLNDNLGTKNERGSSTALAVAVSEEDEENIIVWVMGRCDLDSSGSKAHIDQFGVLDDRNTTTIEWMDKFFAVQVLVPKILRMDSNCCISQHSLKTSGGYNDLFIGIFYRVGKGSKCSKLVFSMFVVRISFVCFDVEESSLPTR